MINPAICQLSVIPVRAGASDRDEIVTQLLFGELVNIITTPENIKKNWCQIRCDWDGYEGWADIRQFKSISAEQLENYRHHHAFCLDLTSILINTDHFLPITLGATLPCFDGLSLSLGNKHYTFNGQALSKVQTNPTSEFIVKLARRYLFAPYLWGGRSPFGIDCSGFTQIVFRMAGIRLRRDASQQAEQGRLVDFVEQIQPADLAFFENDKGRIVHVGIILSDNQIIHAAGQVRIDKLDHFGIYNEDRGIYTHKLRIVKRFLPDSSKTPPPSVLTDSTKDISENQISMF